MLRSDPAMQPSGGSNGWWIYILSCDDKLYTGIATDPERRLAEHLARGSRAARFTRASRRIEMRYSVFLGSRALALRAESRIKRLPRLKKSRIVELSPSGDELLTMLGLD